MYYTYVLLCENNLKKASEMYVGYCENLQERFKKHLKKEIKTTKSFNKVSLIYYEACLSKTDAIKREKQLKTGFGRGYLKRRLESYLKKRV